MERQGTDRLEPSLSVRGANHPYARAAGYEGVFGQEMLTPGYVSRFVTDWFVLAAIHELSTRFEARALTGDTLMHDRTVADVSESPAVIEADLRVSNQDGERSVSGSVAAELS